MDKILQKVELDISINPDFGEVLQFIGHLCLQEVGRTVEAKYKIVKRFFSLFVDHEFNELNK